MGSFCAQAPVVMMGANPLDSSLAQDNLLAGACQLAFGGGNGPDVAYTYTAAVDEDLFLGLANAEGADHGLVVRSACDASSAELACADNGSSSAVNEFTLVRLTAGQTVFVFVSADSAATAGQFLLFADRRPVVGPNAACDPTGSTSACQDGLECNPTGPTTGTCGNNAAAGTMACAAAVPVPPTGMSFMGTTANTVDFTPSTCGADFGGGDAVYSYTALLNSNVTFTVTSEEDVVLSVRTTCADVATEVGCADQEFTGQEQVVVPNVASGTTLYVVVSGVRPGDEGPFVLDVEETPVVASGASCDPIQVEAGQQACAPNTTCRVVGTNPQARCYPTAAPILTAVQAFRSDTNGNGTPDHWRLVASGSDTDLDVVAFRLRFTDSAGNEQPLRLDAGGTRSTLESPLDVPVETPPTSTFTGLTWDLPGLEFVANQAQLANVGLRLVDAQGRVSGELVVPFSSVAAGGPGMACTATPGSFCVQNTRCVANTCQNPATAACATATLLANNPPPAGDVTGGTFTMGNTTATADVVDPTCVNALGGKDALFRYTVTNPGSDLLVQVLNGEDVAVAIRNGCGDVTTEVACERGFSGDPLYTGVLTAAAGTYSIQVSASVPGREGPFAVRAWERPVLGAGAACDLLSALNRCAPGTSCRVAGSTPVCSNGTAPTLTAATALTVDLDADGLFDEILASISGTDAESDVVEVRYTTLDALDRQVGLYVRQGTDGPVNFGDTFAGSFAPGTSSFDGHPHPLFAPGSGDWLAVINQTQVRAVQLLLVDNVGLVSAPLRVPLTPMPIINTRAACDPLRRANRCGSGRSCSATGPTTSECLTQAEGVALACSAPATLARNVDTEGDTALGINASASSCSRSPDAADVIYRFTNSGAAGDVTFVLESASDQGLAVYDTCGGSEEACVDNYAGGEPERLTVPMAAGQTVFVVVTPFTGAEAGPFLLRAE